MKPEVKLTEKEAITIYLSWTGTSNPDGARMFVDHLKKQGPSKKTRMDKKVST